MKTFVILSFMAFSSQAFAIMPAALEDLAGKSGVAYSAHERGECELKREASNVEIRTNIPGLKKVIIFKADKLIAINNSQYRSQADGKLLCGKHGLLSDFREQISMEADSILVTRSYECGEKEYRFELFCSMMR